jgi:long-chain acyl-CoA synthetase
LSITADIRSLPDMARVWSGRTPNKAALIDGGRVVTYAQLNDRSNRFANTLAAAGIRPGSHVGFLGKNSAAFFEIWVGANKAGCALVPLNWRSAPAELVEVVQDATVPLIFAGRDFTELAERVRQATGTAVQVIPEDELSSGFRVAAPQTRALPCPTARPPCWAIRRVPPPPLRACRLPMAP